MRRSLRVGAADDLYEREADEIARAVVDSIGRDDVDHAVPGGIGAARSGASGGSASRCNRTRLPWSAPRAVMSVGRWNRASDRQAAVVRWTRRFGVRSSAWFDADFSRIRLHTNSEVAPKIGATAFTLGSDLRFARGA